MTENTTTNTMVDLYNDWFVWLLVLVYTSQVSCVWTSQDNHVLTTGLGKRDNTNKHLTYNKSRSHYDHWSRDQLQLLWKLFDHFGLPSKHYPKRLNFRVGSSRMISSVLKRQSFELGDTNFKYIRPVIVTGPIRVDPDTKWFRISPTFPKCHINAFRKAWLLIEGVKSYSSILQGMIAYRWCEVLHQHYVRHDCLNVWYLTATKATMINRNRNRKRDSNIASWPSG